NGSKPFGNLTGYIVKMRRLAANHRTDTYNGVEAFRVDNFPDGQRQFPGTRNPVDCDIVRVRAQTAQDIGRAIDQSTDDEIVKSTCDYCELKTIGFQVTCYGMWHCVFNSLSARAMVRNNESIRLTEYSFTQKGLSTRPA